MKPVRKKLIDIEPYGEGIPGFLAWDGEEGKTWELVLADWSTSRGAAAEARPKPQLHLYCSKKEAEEVCDFLTNS